MAWLMNTKQALPIIKSYLTTTSIANISDSTPQVRIYYSCLQGDLNGSLMTSLVIFLFRVNKCCKDEFTRQMLSLVIIINSI